MAIVISASFFSCSIEDEVTEIQAVPEIVLVNDTTIVVQQLGYNELSYNMVRYLNLPNGEDRITLRVSENDDNLQSREIYVVINSLDFDNEPELVLGLNSSEFDWVTNVDLNVYGESPSENYFILRGYPNSSEFEALAPPCPTDNLDCRKDSRVRFRVFVDVTDQNRMLDKGQDGEYLHATQLLSLQGEFNWERKHYVYEASFIKRGFFFVRILTIVLHKNLTLRE